MKENPASSTQNAERTLRLILPKKGRLAEDFAAIMDGAGLRFKKEGDRLDYGATADKRGVLNSMETLLQRSGDALENLRDGLGDVAIVGRDTFEEVTGRDNDGALRIAETFNDCSACAMWIAVPDGMSLECPGDLEGLRIVTSYPNALKSWLENNGVKGVKIIARDGGIEDYVRLGLADAVCDVVDTGGTLAANKLTRQIKLFDSSAVLVVRNGDYSAAASAAITGLCDRLAGRDMQEQPRTPQSPVAEPAPAAAFA